MKVLKPGSGAKEWTSRQTCTGRGNGGGGCGALLEVGLSDLYRTHSYHYDGSHEIYTTFRCPGCKTESDMKEFEAPSCGLPEKMDHPAWNPAYSLRKPST